MINSCAILMTVHVHKQFRGGNTPVNVFMQHFKAAIVIIIMCVNSKSTVKGLGMPGMACKVVLLKVSQVFV